MNNKIWSTEKINNILSSLQTSDKIDTGCFFEQDFELRNQNIIFQLTHEENEEFNKCSDDVNYFVEKYCRFLTDYGRITTTLVPHQKNILNTLSDEVWIDKLQDFGPSMRNYILMASRQSYKCLTFNTEILVKNIITNKIYKTTLGQLYQSNFKKSLKTKILSKIKLILYKLYNFLSNE